MNHIHPLGLLVVAAVAIAASKVFVVPDTQSVQILSDDGDVATVAGRCEKLDKQAQSFRTVTFVP